GCRAVAAAALGGDSPSRVELGVRRASHSAVSFVNATRFALSGDGLASRAQPGFSNKRLGVCSGAAVEGRTPGGKRVSSGIYALAPGLARIAAAHLGCRHDR